VWCDQNGQLTFAKLADYKYPVSDGGPMFDPENRWSLCRTPHGVKREMEEFARRTEQLDRLPIWCDDPAERPREFR
jgi:hypothetical protein